MVLWRPTRSSRTKIQKRCLFIIGHWNAKVGSQETPGVTGKFGLGGENETGQRLIEFCQENTLVIANILFQQDKRRLYTWTSPDSQHWNQIDYIICSQRWRNSIQSARTRPGADYGSDHELIAVIRGMLILFELVFYILQINTQKWKIFWGISIVFSILTAPIYTPTNSAWGFPFLYILSNACYFLSFW